MARYFDENTDRSIELFLKTTDDTSRHQIFDRDIRPAFEKLIESIIYIYRFWTIDEVDTLKMECLTALYETLPKYDPAKSNKGFSYFNVVAKNWFVQRAKEKSKRNRQENNLYHDFDSDVAKNDPNFVVSPHEDALIDDESWKSFFQEMDRWRSKSLKSSERSVLEAVIYLFRNPEFPIYNKKAIYLYIREMTGLNTKQVVVNLKRLKGYYQKFRERSLSEGE